MHMRSAVLPHLGLLRFQGPDRLTFLQGQISHDTRRLGEGRALLAACANPQGRVLAVLQLLPHESGVIAILPRELVEPMAAHLGRYRLRAKVTIDPVGAELALAGVHEFEALAAAGLAAGGPAAEGAGADARHYHEIDGLGVARVSGDPRRAWVIGPPAELAARGFPDDPARRAEVERDWRLADVRAGLPQVFAATRELFVPQMLNLDLLDGISFTKGCYTGQEIVTRTQHRGRIKRRMLRVALAAGDTTTSPAAGAATLPATPAPGAHLRLADGRVGRIVDAQPGGSGYEALAVVSLDAAEPEVETAPPAAAAGAGAAAGAAATPADDASWRALEVLPLPYAV
ncbi:MAG: folate-binding protein YgfZ [Gammaproteobacteria bacterium]|nr:folate-binding protein YgfZ [Gammaproteobacteria bacterium]